MNTPIRIMIDFETGASSNDAAILSLGACTFGLPFGVERKQFYAKASVQSNHDLKRKFDPATMAWWDKQNADVRNEAFSGTLAVDDVIDGFAQWAFNLLPNKVVNNADADIELWSRGAGFDCEILQHAFYQIFGKYPFDFRKHMCQRTIERLMPEQLKLGRGGAHSMKHHALNDAIFQAELMDVALRNLNWFPGKDQYAS